MLRWTVFGTQKIYSSACQ